MFEDIIKIANIDTEYYDKIKIYLNKYVDRKADNEVTQQIVSSLMVLSKLDLLITVDTAVAHTIENLDAAGATTIPLEDQYSVAEGAAGYACVQMAVSNIENNNLNSKNLKHNNINNSSSNNNNNDDHNNKQ